MMKRILRLALLGLISLTSVSPSLSADSPVADAAERNDLTAVRTLLEEGDNPNAAQVDGMRAIHWAAYHDATNMIRHLLQANADANVENDYGVRPIFLVCQHGNGTALRMLLDSGAEPDVTLKSGETPLMTAARTGDIDCVQALLGAGVGVNATERSNQTAIMWAAAEGHADVVKELLEAGAEYEQPLKSGFTPFLFAVRSGHVDVVDLFLKKGVDVNAVMKTDQTGGEKIRGGTAALMLAVENGHFELAAELLNAGADPNDQRSGYTPLHALTWVRKPNSGDGDDGDPPPRGSGKLSSLEFVRVLVEAGADVNCQLDRGPSGRGKLSHKGMTPFMLAADTADLPLLKQLAELRADPSITNDDGATPLMAAAGLGTTAPTEEAGTESESLATVRWLIELGGDVNTVDANGETAMHGAAYANFAQMVKLLDANGADIEVWHRPNRYGWTPLIIAQGFRPGNFKPAPATIDALDSVMRSHGVDPPPPPSRNPTEDDRYKKKK